MKRVIAAVLLALPLTTLAFAAKPAAAETYRQERREIRREGATKRAEIRREQARRRTEARRDNDRRVWVDGRWVYRR